MIHGRLLNRSVRSRLSLPAAIVALAAFAMPGAATATTPSPNIATNASTLSPKWQFQWRPNWLPGDPVADDLVVTGTALRTVSVPSPGLRIYLDPVTRKVVMPTPEQRKAAAADAARAAAHEAPFAPDAFHPVERLPGGGEMMHLNGRFQIYSVARRDANGRIVITDASNLEDAKKVLAQPAPVRPAREER